jgi:hypothetical protein
MEDERQRHSGRNRQRGDKVLSVSKMTLNPDGKTAKIMVDDKLHGTTSQFGAVKQ